MLHTLRTSEVLENASVRFTRTYELEDIDERLGSFVFVLCRNIEVTIHLLHMWSLCTGPVKRICSAQKQHTGKGLAWLLTYAKEVGGESVVCHSRV